MTEQNINELKKKIIDMGKLLWSKDLVSGLNGNISLKVDANQILITATKTCLGFLEEKDILLVNLMKEDGKQTLGTSTEKLLHTILYKSFVNIQAVIHTHTPYINGYFLERDTFTSRIIESKIALGEVRSAEQLTPSVTDVGPVLEMMTQSNIGVLRNHGVLAMGENLFDCFLYIQSLEEAIKIESISNGFKGGPAREKAQKKEEEKLDQKFKLFSKEQIDAIVKVINEDVTLQQLGQKTNMTMDLAVKMEETGDTFSFQFKDGKIVNVGNDENAEFLITANEKIWRAVFNREIDPFVATTQKKMNLRGDFSKISKWYAPCSRIFEVWTKVPIE